MKRGYCLAIAVLLLTKPLYGDKQELNSRSFMFTRPIDYNLAQRNHGRHLLFYALTKDNVTGGALHTMVMYQQSLSLSRTERYFLFDRKNSLSVAGDMSFPEANRSKRDIRAEWVGLSPEFRGELTLCPKQRQWSIFIEYIQSIGALFPNTQFFNNSWITIAMPITYVENHINLQQSAIYEQGSNPIQSIPEAFNQSRWCYGRFNPNKKDIIRPAEIRFTLGTTYEHSRTLELTYYTLLSIPTGKKPDPKYIFNPVVGNGGHIGWGGGMECSFLLSCHDPKSFSWYFFLALESILLVRNTQYRTFDLKGKPWSRYLLYNIADWPPTHTPGVNLLTLRVRSRPYNIADFSMGWRFRFPRCEIECGYNIWGHGDERLHFTRPLTPTFGIAGTGSIIDMHGNTVGATAHESNIKKQAHNDTTFVPIRPDDIDLCSGAAASAINHRLHAGLNYTYNHCTATGFIGFGIFGEIIQKNRPIQLWGGWLTIGASF